MNNLLEAKQKDHNLKSLNIQRRNNSYLLVKSEPIHSIEVFFNRLITYIDIDYTSIVLTNIYIARIYNKIKPSRLNLHKVLIASMITAMKFNEDTIYSNSDFAELAGISCQSVNLMEIEFLEEIDYRLTYTQDEYIDHSERLTSSRHYEEYLKRDLFK